MRPVTALEVSLIVVVSYTVVELSLSPLAGALSDRYGSRLLLLLGTGDRWPAEGRRIGIACGATVPLPSQLVPWGTWRETHPNTLALKVDRGRYGRETFRPQYVIGVTLGESATAFPYKLAAQAGIINDDVSPHPVVVHVDAETQGVHVYLRQVDECVLTFISQHGLIQDQETSSTWQMDGGPAVDGPLKGQILRSVPYIPAFPQAWRDFYPHSRWYEGSCLYRNSGEWYESRHYCAIGGIYLLSVALAKRRKKSGSPWLTELPLCRFRSCY